MTHAPTPLKLRATTAICAVLALGSTPAWAQDAAPTIDLPTASVPAEPPVLQAPPVIQLPSETPAAPPAAASVSQPMVQQTPPQVTPSADSVPPVAEEGRAAARAANPARPAARAAAPVRSEAAAQPIAAAPVAAVVPPVAPLAAVPAAELAPTVSDPAAPVDSASTTHDIVDGDSALGAGALAALVVGLGLGGAWLAFRGRRRHRPTAYDDAYETRPAQAYDPAPAPAVVVAEPTTGRMTAAPLPAFAFADDQIDQDAPVQREIGTEELAPATAAPVRHEAAAPDTRVPRSRAERDVLLQQMIAAEPDAENPFTSRKARLRRARIILQSREIDHNRDATQPFDWRTYKPSTSNPAPATPPRVTA